MADSCDDADGGTHDVTITPQATGIPEFLCALSFAIRGIELAKLLAPDLLLEAATEIAAAANAANADQAGDGAAAGGGAATRKGRGSRAKPPTEDEPEYDPNRVILGVVEDQPRPPSAVYSEHHQNLVANGLPVDESRLTTDEKAVITDILSGTPAGGDPADPVATEPIGPGE